MPVDFSASGAKIVREGIPELPPHELVAELVKRGGEINEKDLIILVNPSRNLIRQQELYSLVVQQILTLDETRGV